MVTICCTSKLLKRTGFPVEASIPDPTTALGNWYANILFFHHLQILLFVSDNSRLAVVTPAREIRSLASHLTDNLSILLLHLGAPQNWIDQEIREMTDARFAATRSRSVLGTMNEYKYQIEAILDESGIVNPLEMSIELSNILVGPLDYRLPREVAIDLLRRCYNGA